MNTVKTDSITQFIEKIKSINLNKSPYGHPLWFRAECSTYNKTHLIPNLFREYIVGPSPMIPFYAKESNIRHFFKNEAYPFLRKFNLENDDLGSAFIMQHYSSHTRLLDWTENALISLFFAVENIYSKNDAYIWILDAYKLNSSTKKIVTGENIDHLFLYPSINPEEKILNYFNEDLLRSQSNNVKFPIAIKPFYIDDRMKSQSSCFTLFGHEFDGLKKHPFHEDFLQKIIIPHTSFRDIKRDLYQLGFSYDTVYPGLEGISKKSVYAFDEYFI